MDPRNTGETHGQVYSYNLDHTATPGALKVRWKVRIAAGAEAARLDELQQQAIISLLTWADENQNRQRHGHGKHPETPL
jgi:hypothetical protein